MSGDLLASDAEAIVNTVNTVGIMGKGIALQFKKKFPDNFRAYERACYKGEIGIGRVFVYETGQLTNPRFIINFPTKQHWKEKTKLEYINRGLSDLANIIKILKINSIAVPPLGCGNGGLDWKTVRPMIEKSLGLIDGLDLRIYNPEGAPSPDKQPVSGPLPEMTPGRAALIGLMKQYLIPGYKFTKLEIQKLAYFLQEAGQPLRLRFEHGQYGPYANNLNHVLQRIDGHFIRGYGDGTQKSRIELLEGASVSARELLEGDPETQDRLERVSRLIEGFETPYGMELLATTHWLATHEKIRAATAQEAINGFQQWNARKSEIFLSKHIEKAWTHLSSQGWLS